MIFKPTQLFSVVIAVLFSTCLCAAEEKPNLLTAEELNDGWILLFDGETLFGWQPHEKANWKVKDGAIAVSEGDQGLLCTTSEFADYELQFDFRAPAATNSGVFLRTPTNPQDPAMDCYELNIAPSDNPFPTGSFVKRQKAKDVTTKQAQGSPVGNQATGPNSPPGFPGSGSSDWTRVQVTANGGHFVVKLNGQQVLDYTDAKPICRGHIGLQHNMGEVAFRNIKLKPLGLTSIFNGKDTTGWSVVPDKKMSEFAVTKEGWLNVKNGPGSLETTGKYGDFVAQFECISNGKHLNSGLFFRCVPGLYQQGYESQIQNGFKDGDRTMPIDCGTGGFYRRQNARRVVSDDFTWFHKTLVVSGPHMAAWVNGIQVSDWTDPRPANDNPRQGLRTEPGTLQIQGHDPTTDLSFRNFRAGEMGK